MDKKKLLIEFYTERSKHQERILWIGCNPDNPEIWKKQQKQIEEEANKFKKFCEDWIKKWEEGGK